MQPLQTITSSVDHRGVATLTLNRPQVHNAFNDVVITELTHVLGRLGADPAVRVVVLTGVGETFSAGGDLGWMKSMIGFSAAENEADARQLANLLELLDRLPKPTVARVNGSALGGWDQASKIGNSSVPTFTGIFSLFRKFSEKYLLNETRVPIRRW